MRRISTLFAILLFVASARSAGLPSLDVDGAEAIDRMFRSAVDKGEIPGVVAAVVNKDLRKPGMSREEGPPPC